MYNVVDKHNVSIRYTAVTVLNKPRAIYWYLSEHIQTNRNYLVDSSGIVVHQCCWPSLNSFCILLFIIWLYILTGWHPDTHTKNIITIIVNRSKQARSRAYDCNHHLSCSPSLHNCHIICHRTLSRCCFCFCLVFINIIILLYC